MGSETDGGSELSLTELFVLKFVLADVVIIFALLFAGPLYAVAITALFVVSFLLVWYLTREREESPSRSERAADGSAQRTDRDPVTKLQDRYAAGELSEAEFEEKLERLIDANERAERAGIETEELELERSS
ncbi:SHOCT domain-containing protein [Natrarchaeobius oligotrophus]|uniref:SHOCT domain-containing protein n=1 Tax=Natrarchaeobius chitinivorans TaxID=1679083 RepID=A0A3N6MBK2_NATCH|nr:SHOCT domain-containing protein [Natrarchaeobius chitinivorans]RQG99977.1 SHOCT domain-containing protein [Natrarchaeobius chitinivorans]